MDDWNEKPRREFFIGLDLGEMKDFSALCILERIAHRETEFLECRTLHRWPNGTKYPVIVDHVSKILESKLLQVTTHWPSGNVEVHFAPRTLVVDRGGVGLAVVNMFQDALPADVEMCSVFVHAGRTVTSTQVGFMNIPKRDLIFASVAAFQTKKLRVAASVAFAEALKTELQDYRRKISDSGRDTYEAGRGHDDLVFALSLAVWAAGQQGLDTGIRPVSDDILRLFSWR